SRPVSNSRRIENGGLTETDKQKIRTEIENAHALGYAEGVKATEAKQHGTGEFRNTDGQLEWTEVALFLQREKRRLPDRHHEFIDDMASRTVYGREPTPKAAQVSAQFVLQARRDNRMSPQSQGPQARPGTPTVPEAALDYARCGIPVFPCNPIDK